MVIVHSLVLFGFSSQPLQALVTSIGLPRIPLMPVSSSRAVVGAVLGIALARDQRRCGRSVGPWLRNIALGWVATPAAAAVVRYLTL